MLSAKLQSKRLVYDISTGDAITLAPSAQQLLLHSFAVVNGSASSMDCGMGYKLNSNGFSIYTSVSGSLAAASSTPTLFTTADNDGYYIQSKTQFDMVLFVITSASAGGTYEYCYWNGSAFTAFTPKVSPDHSSTGQKALIFVPHYKWVTGTGGVSGLDSTRYTIRVRATTHPTTAVSVSTMQVCKLLAFRESVEGNQSLELDLNEYQLLLEQGEALVPYFSTANSENVVEVSYRINP